MPIEVVEVNEPDDKNPTLKTIVTRRELADLLKVTDRGLCHLLYAIPESQLYRQFEIEKKSGGVRKINVPIPRLKALQRRLLKLLYEDYSPSNAVQAFRSDRSILHNAKRHTRRRFVLNIDLKDFFPSINFGRIRGLLMAKPFEYSEQVATVIAQICTHKNELPQGAPTSPILSNMICGKLDFQLARLADKYNCRYTRYADDITISSAALTFPLGLATHTVTEAGQITTLGKGLRSTIENNGFEVNDKKSRLQKSNQQQVVTGLVVNEKPNLSRRYVRNVRAMLRRWELESIGACQEDFVAKYSSSKSMSFKETLKGRIEFIGSIRGKHDYIYLRLLERLAACDSKLVTPKSARQMRERLDMASTVLGDVWILESTIDSPFDCKQSTGFFVKELGIVTCEHGIINPEEIVAYRRNSQLPQKGEVIVWSKDRDIALINLEDFPETSLEISTAEIRLEDEIKVVGFPQFAPGNSGSVVAGRITGTIQNQAGVKLYTIDANILEGNSGGPVFDKNWRVIGVAVRGNEADGEGPGRYFNCFVPILEAVLLAKGR